MLYFEEQAISFIISGLINQGNYAQASLNATTGAKDS